MKKYKLTKETKEFYDRTLHRIKALRDFSDVRKGELGGWIESEKNLSHEGDCWVYKDAIVYENAEVYGDARVFEDAWVYGNARVFENAIVSGDARVCGNARVFEDAMVYGNATVYGNARMYGNAMVCGNAEVCGDAWIRDIQVYGNVVLKEDKWYKCQEEMDIMASPLYQVLTKEVS